MKLLIGISSCQAYETKGNNQAMRDTWLTDAAALGLEHRFFHGEGAEPKEDVVVLPCNDGYLGLMHKDKLQYTWALEQDYDYVYRCDHDSYCCPERLLVSRFEGYDMAGCRGPLNSIEGGPGFFISKKLMQLYVDKMEEACKGFVIQGKNVVNDFYNSYLNDWWTTALAKHHNLSMAGSTSFVHLWTLDAAGPRRDNNIVSAHLSTVTPPGYVNVGGRECEHRYRPSFMLQKHQEWLGSNGNGWTGANFLPF